MAAAVAVFLLGERTAYAYIDPGTGSLIYQTALTLLLGLGLCCGAAAPRLSRFVRRLGGRDVAAR